MLRKLDYICGRVWENLKYLPFLLVVGTLKVWWSLVEVVKRFKSK